MKMLAAALWLAAAASAGATPIYRCGQSYSQTPCAGGKLVDAADPRSAAQRAEAREVADRERALADGLTRDREAQDAAPRAAATGIDARAPSKPASQPVPKARKKKGVPREVIVIVPRNNR